MEKIREKDVLQSGRNGLIKSARFSAPLFSSGKAGLDCRWRIFRNQLIETD